MMFGWGPRGCTPPTLESLQGGSGGTSTATFATAKASPPAFTTWRDLAGGTKAFAYDTRTSLSYSSSSGEFMTYAGPWSSNLVEVERDTNGVLKGFNPETSFTMQGSLAGVGQPAILTTTTGAGVDPIALVANPYDAGWNYQSFGVWNQTNVVQASSFGAATPGSAIPATGAATFTGKLAGIYVSPTGQRSSAAADVTVNANFTTRSMDFASTATVLTRDLANGSAAPQLNLSGTLNYQRPYNSFAGTLTSAGGTLSGATSGRFYGPAAQELGGAFALKSTTSAEAFVGGYGAKR